MSTKDNEVRLMLERIDHNTKHHPPDAQRISQHELIRSAARVFMKTVAVQCPASRETSLALTHEEEAMM